MKAKQQTRLHWKRKIERDASRNTLVSGEPPLTQHQHQADGGGFQAKDREHTLSPSTGHLCFKFLFIHITKDLTWSAHTDAELKKAHQLLFYTSGARGSLE